ncbi:MAG: TIGR03790 family protein, partial [Deltaproteobacteria bacterium]|nr:TIGR03790 family protein [Deltaproteobacteria bacterium]
MVSGHGRRFRGRLARSGMTGKAEDRGVAGPSPGRPTVRSGLGGCSAQALGAARAMAVAGLLLFLRPSPLQAAQGPGPANVLVVANSSSAASLAIATHYQQARDLPPANRCDLELPDEYQVSYEDFLALLKTPLADCLEQKGLSDQVLFIVLTRGIPGVISGAGEVVLGQDLTSVDSFLFDLHGELEYAENPYFKSTKRFTRENGFQGYLVTRLDGPTVDVAMDLVDRAQAPGADSPELTGTAYLDLEPNGDNPVDRGVIAGAGTDGNGQIQHAADLLTEAGWTVHLDSNDAEFGTEPALLSCPDARWYFGWYKAFSYNDAFEWATGASGIHLDSFSAMNYREAGSWCAGALSKGITATAGAVWEPYILWYMKGDRFLEAFVVDRVTLAEAAYRAIPRNCWMMVVFGDPLFQLQPVSEPPEPAPEAFPEAFPEALSEPSPEAFNDVADIGRMSDSRSELAVPIDSGDETTASSDPTDSEPVGVDSSIPGRGGGGCGHGRRTSSAALPMLVALLG